MDIAVVVPVISGVAIASIVRVQKQHFKQLQAGNLHSGTLLDMNFSGCLI